MAEDDVSREELIEARGRLQLQLDRLQKPLIPGYRNRALTARLQNMIAEIDELLAEDETD